jgi:hypothetical protein
MFLFKENARMGNLYRTCCIYWDYADISDENKIYQPPEFGNGVMVWYSRKNEL